MTKAIAKPKKLKLGEHGFQAQKTMELIVAARKKHKPDGPSVRQLSIIGMMSGVLNMEERQASTYYHKYSKVIDGV